MVADPVAAVGFDAERAYALIAQLPDPEIPSLTLADLGVIRSVDLSAGVLTVAVTPTYSACPATDFIKQAIADTLAQAGFRSVNVVTVLSPAWSTDWLSEDAWAKLRAEGIAPPCARIGEPEQSELIACPRCGAPGAQRISAFGSTPCQGLARCLACGEPFGFFKVL